jgi:hypothetical protein
MALSALLALCALPPGTPCRPSPPYSLLPSFTHAHCRHVPLLGRDSPLPPLPPPLTPSAATPGSTSKGSSTKRSAKRPQKVRSCGRWAGPGAAGTANAGGGGDVGGHCVRRLATPPYAVPCTRASVDALCAVKCKACAVRVCSWGPRAPHRGPVRRGARRRRSSRGAAAPRCRRTARRAAIPPRRAQRAPAMRARGPRQAGWA